MPNPRASKFNINADGAWVYTDAHDLYPVNPGDAWTVGPHRFICGDLEEHSYLQQALNGISPTLMYVDPPWNNGNARSFRTKAGVDGLQGGRPVDMMKLLTLVLAPASDLNLLAFVETGRREAAKASQLIENLGGHIGNEWPITYYRRNPCVLLAADFRHNPVNDYPDFTGMDDDDTPLHALRHYPTGTVIDPCAGRGLTARSAHNAGWKSLNHELSPFRTAEALKSVAATTGLAPTFQLNYSQERTITNG